MFLVFFIRNNFAGKYLFGVDIDAAERSSDVMVKEWASSAVVFHRMEASFGMTISVLILANTITNPHLTAHAPMLLGLFFMAFVLLINHSSVYAHGPSHAKNVAPSMLVTIGRMRVMSLVMMVWFGILMVMAYYYRESPETETCT